MTQIVNRRVAAAALISTLADGSAIEIDSIMKVLTHKAFLFEYKLRAVIATTEIGQWQRAGGFQAVLVDGGISTSEVITILAGAQITDEDAHREVPIRQQLFAIGEVTWNSFETSGLDGHGTMELHFKPASKGGIPFHEGSGWKVLLVNNSGAVAVTGDSFGNSVIYERFAYEGGS